MKSRFKQYTVNRLLKQVNQAEFEFKEYGAPKIRYNTHADILYILFEYELPDRARGSRTWKRHRKTQYK